MTIVVTTFGETVFGELTFEEKVEGLLSLGLTEAAVQALIDQAVTKALLSTAPLLGTITGSTSITPISVIQEAP